jgi:peptidoglycan/LPS O-acetylase OafA/YrhL
MRRTIADRMVETSGRPTGFDYMRLVLAVAILCWHSVVICYGKDVETAVGSSLGRPLMAVLLPAFFTLSGFLVAGSLQRTRTIGMFLSLRALRIFPALAVESLLMALLLGPLLTVLPLGQYFADPQFHAYFLNILGDPHFGLPGVFTRNPFWQVNGQLWTVPFELRCYVVLAAFGLLGAVKRRAWMLWASVGYFAVTAGGSALKYPAWFLETNGALPGNLLVASFLIGVVVFLYREKIAWNLPLAFICLAVGMGLLDLPGGHWLAIFPIAYATVVLGLTNPRKTRLLDGADYSYGIFLYSAAVQQTFVALCPWGRHWWINIAVCIPATTLVAALSWHLVEKPALGLKSGLAKLEAHWLARTSRAGGAVNDNRSLA